MMMNSDAGNDTDNQPPAITGSPAQTITLPNAVTLTATASNPDVRPRGRGRRAAATLTIRWIHYRGPGQIFFSEPRIEPTAPGKPTTSTVQATFSTRGDYVVRAVASYEGLQTPFDIPVTAK